MSDWDQEAAIISVMNMFKLLCVHIISYTVTRIKMMGVLVPFQARHDYHKTVFFKLYVVTAKCMLQLQHYWRPLFSMYPTLYPRNLYLEHSSILIVNYLFTAKPLLSYFLHPTPALFIQP